MSDEPVTTLDEVRKLVEDLKAAASRLAGFAARRADKNPRLAQNAADAAGMLLSYSISLTSHAASARPD